MSHPRPPLSPGPVAVGLDLDGMLEHAPLIILLLTLGAAILRVGAAIPGWLAGLGPVLTGRVTVGSRIRWSAGEGRLVAAGWFRARIQDQGGTRHVPWSALAGTIEVEPPRAVPVAVEVEVTGDPTRVREALEGRVAMCPYRVWGSPPTVRIPTPPPRRVRLEVRVWSTSAVPAASSWLDRAERVELGQAGLLPD